MAKYGISCGIVGLPNVGKSTLFKSLTKKQVEASNYPFCTIDPNVGVVELKDERLINLSKISKSKKIVFASVTFVDIAGLVRGASKGEGLGNKFLSNIKETDVILHVVRCFEDENVSHVEGNLDPELDAQIIDLELILSDLQTAENIKIKIERQAKGDKKLIFLLDTLKKIIINLNDNISLKNMELSSEELEEISNYNFLTLKKVIYVANVSEKDIVDLEKNIYFKKLQNYAKKEEAQLIPICAKLEEELVQLDENELLEYLNSINLKETSLDTLIKISFKTLGLITYITTGELETRAWTIKRGTKAQSAAGKIHKDIEKGFIRAEVITYSDMIKYGSRILVKEAGKAKIEGKDYEVKDGDIILFYHN